MKIKIFYLCVFILCFNSYAFAAFTFTPRLTITEEYSDNLDLAPENERSDWFTTISPGATLEFRERKYGFYLDYEPSYVFYNRYSEDDTLRHRGTIGLWTDLSRHTRFSVENVALYTEEPYSQEDITLRRERNNYFLNTTTASFNYQFGVEDSFDIGYIYEFINYDQDSISDTQRHEPYMVLTYWLEPNEWGTETSFSYRKGIYGDVDDPQVEPEDDFDFWTAGFRLIKRFTHRLDGIARYSYSEYDDSTDDYTLHEIGPGIRYTIGENTDLHAEIIYLYRNREVRQDQEGLLFLCEILQTWDFSRSSLELTGRSGYRPDTFGTDNFGFNLFAEAEATYLYNFTRQTQWDLFGSARYDEYVDFDPNRIDNTFRAGTGITYQALSWARFRAGYTYSRVLSDDYYYEYAENRFLLSVTLMPERTEDSSQDELRGRRANTPISREEEDEEESE